MDFLVVARATGNSIIVTIPKMQVLNYGIVEGDYITLRVEDVLHPPKNGIH